MCRGPRYIQSSRVLQRLGRDLLGKAPTVPGRFASGWFHPYSLAKQLVHVPECFKSALGERRDVK